MLRFGLFQGFAVVFGCHCVLPMYCIFWVMSSVIRLSPKFVCSPADISKTPRLLNTLENTFYPLDMLQVGFKRVSRSNLHNLMRTFSRDFFFFKLGLYPFLHLFSLFCTFSCLTHPSKLIMRKKVRPSDGQVVSSTHQAKQKWSQVKSRLYLNVLLLQNYCCYCPTHHSPLPRALLLPHVLLPRPTLLLPLPLLLTSAQLPR